MAEVALVHLVSATMKKFLVLSSKKNTKIKDQVPYSQHFIFFVTYVWAQ